LPLVDQPGGSILEEQIRLGQLVSFQKCISISFLYLTIHRDVDELKAMKEEILTTDSLEIKLGGMSFTGFSMGGA
jgi:hypothetical protein